MKRKNLLRFLAVVLIMGLFTVNAYAAGSYQDKDIPIGSSSEVLMVGEIEPTIMSVTIPSYVPFHISRSIETENKVISPRITMISHSGVPVSVDVVYTNVNLSNLQGTTWGSDRYVSDNQIAIGFQPETIANQMPTSLAGTKWLQANTYQNVHVMSLTAYGESTMYVVGTLGSAVPENDTFSVIPTFVVRQVR